MKNKQKAILITIGITICSVSQVVVRFTKIPDLVFGTAMGVGIGIMIIALVKSKPVSAN